MVCGPVCLGSSDSHWSDEWCLDDALMEEADEDGDEEGEEHEYGADAWYSRALVSKALPTRRLLRAWSERRVAERLGREDDFF